MEDGITTLLKDEMKTILEAMTETIDGEDIPLFEKVTKGRLERIGAYSKPVGEILSDDEDDFLYTFQKHHASRGMIFMVSIFVKGLTEEAETKKDNLKDLVITEFEDNPNFNEKAITSQILRVRSGIRVDGMGKSAKLYSGAQIIVKAKVSNPLG